MMYGLIQSLIYATFWLVFSYLYNLSDAYRDYDIIADNNRGWHTKRSIQMAVIVIITAALCTHVIDFGFDKVWWVLRLAVMLCSVLSFVATRFLFFDLILNDLRGLPPMYKSKYAVSTRVVCYIGSNILLCVLLFFVFVVKL